MVSTTKNLCDFADGLDFPPPSTINDNENKHKNVNAKNLHHHCHEFGGQVARIQ